MKENVRKNTKKASVSSAGRVIDFVAKILCLIAAFFIWFYAMSNDVITLERDFTVPVVYENENALFDRTGWSVLSGKDGNIVVTVKGKRNIINKITESDIYAFADVSSVERAGRQIIDVEVSAPGECEVVNTSISTVSPYIDKRVTRNVPVKVVYADYVIPSDYQLDEPVVNISEIAVTGPESEISRVAAARAELSLGNMTETVNIASRLELVDFLGMAVNSSYISATTKTVNVTVRLFAVKDVPLTVGYKHGYFNSGNAKITVSPNMVTLRGEPSVLEKIDDIEIAVLDEKKYTANSTQSVTINIPSGTTLMSSESTAVIGVEHINTGTKLIAVKNISLVNSGGLDCELQSDTLNITLRGPYDLLSKISEDNISVTADMKHYSSGSGITVVPVTVDLSAEFEGSVYELESYSVTVNIK